MSSRPITTSLGSTSRGIRHGWRTATIAVPSSARLDEPDRGPAARTRVVARELADADVERADRDAREERPVARPTAGRRSAPGARVTRTTATIATAIPAIVAGCGTPSVSEPDRDRDRRRSGRPSSGATTPIRPTARPRYRLVMPTTPHTPAIAAQPMSVGRRERLAAAATASASAATAPTSWVTPTTPSTGARRLTSPPPKSPVPQLSAESRPRTTTATSGPSSGRRGLLGSTWPSDGGWAVEHDHRVGERVVPVRRRQVDDLEVGRDLAQQLERARRRARRRASRTGRRGSAAAGGRRSRAGRARAGPRGRRRRACPATARVTGTQSPFSGEKTSMPEVRVVDADPLVAAVGDPRDVADHAPLEVARRALHRGLLGGVDLAQRHARRPARGA